MQLKIGSYKYVRVNGEYRFAGVYTDHCQMLKEGETATSAGTIGVGDDDWKFQSLWSMTLKIGAANEDADNIAALIGKPQRIET